jgi:hypothetical protein
MARFRTCPDKLAFQRLAQLANALAFIPLNRNFSALWDRFYNGGYEEDSRFAGALPEFGAKGKLRPKASSSGALRSFESKFY